MRKISVMLLFIANLSFIVSLTNCGDQGKGSSSLSQEPASSYERQIELKWLNAGELNRKFDVRGTFVTVNPNIRANSILFSGPKKDVDQIADSITYLDLKSDKKHAADVHVIRVPMDKLSGVESTVGFVRSFSNVSMLNIGSKEPVLVLLAPSPMGGRLYNVINKVMHNTPILDDYLTPAQFDDNHRIKGGIYKLRELAKLVATISSKLIIFDRDAITYENVLIEFPDKLTNEQAYLGFLLSLPEGLAPSQFGKAIRIITTPGTTKSVSRR